ncbi:MAG: hypothetical protein N4A54_12355 [Peptostreptococcaceae bacterium]|jgi:hypothetical protein|nr:hypothetical protein [Peptostreptococcaceae bacterium]
MKLRERDYIENELILLNMYSKRVNVLNHFLKRLLYFHGGEFVYKMILKCKNCDEIIEQMSKKDFHNIYLRIQMHRLKKNQKFKVKIKELKKGRVFKDTYRVLEKHPHYILCYNINKKSKECINHSLAYNDRTDIQIEITVTI